MLLLMLSDCVRSHLLTYAQMGLMLEWIVQLGGLEVMEKRANVRASKVYEVIDRSNGFYVSAQQSKQSPGNQPYWRVLPLRSACPRRRMMSTMAHARACLFRSAFEEAMQDRLSTRRRCHTPAPARVRAL